MLPLFRAALLLVAVCLGACASDDDCRGIACGPTAPAVEVVVRGVPDATVTCARADEVAVDVSCYASDPDTRCECAAPDPVKAGTYLVHVEAVGYDTAEREVVVDATPPGGCCNPGYIGQTVTIDLEPSP
jgi:hypothetical protein